MKKAKSKDSVESKPKTKSLFDHINHVREGKNPNYFSTLTDADKKTWSNYMVCRFLSMQAELVDTINELQAYQDKLTSEQFYKLCIAVVPKGRRFDAYIKSKADKYNKDLLSLLSRHYQDSERNVVEYIQLLSSSELLNIVSLYGYSEKQIEDLLEKT